MTIQNRHFFRSLFQCLIAAICVTCAALSSPALAVPAPKAGSVQQATQTININKADVAALASALNGVGEAKAKAIVEFREQNGPFKSVDQLLDVKGIGSATLEKNRALISI